MQKRMLYIGKYFAFEVCYCYFILYAFFYTDLQNLFATKKYVDNVF